MPIEPTNQDFLISTLQKQLKKLEDRYIKALDEMRRLEYKHAITSNDLHNFRAVHTKSQELCKQKNQGDAKSETASNEFKYQKIFCRDVAIQCTEKYLKEGEVQKKSIQLIFESKNAEDASATNRELSKLRRKVYELGKEKTQATQELSYLILTLDEKEEMLNESGKRITELEQENLHLKENLKKSGTSAQNPVNIGDLTSFICQYVKEATMKEQNSVTEQTFSEQLNKKDNEIYKLTHHLEVLKKQLNNRRRKNEVAETSSDIEAETAFQDAERTVEDKSIGTSYTSLLSRMKKATAFKECTKQDKEGVKQVKENKKQLVTEEEISSTETLVYVVKKSMRNEHGAKVKDRPISRGYRKIKSPKEFSRSLPQELKNCSMRKVDLFTNSYAGKNYKADKASMVSSLIMLSRNPGNKVKPSVL